MRPGCELNPNLLPLGTGVGWCGSVSDGASIVRNSFTPFSALLGLLPCHSSELVPSSMNHLFCSQFGSQFIPVSPVDLESLPATRKCCRAAGGKSVPVGRLGVVVLLKTDINHTL